MVSKVQERIFAESAASLLAVEWRLIDIPEPLDFEVRCANETFGLEVRQVFHDPEATYGSPTKRNESRNREVVSRLAKRYYESAGPSVIAKFLGALSLDDVEDLVNSMIAEAPTHPGPNVVFETVKVKVFMTPLPASLLNYSRWLLVDDRVGWVREVSASDLQHAINRKQSNLAVYKQKYTNIDLLLVADRTFNSGKLCHSNRFIVNNPGFRAIYFLSYPESVERVG